MIFISPIFYKNEIKNDVYDNTVCPGKPLW